MISVIIPTYNRAATIERSIRSVLDQTYKDLECIVVDDGSRDKTQTVVSAIADPRLHYFRMKQNFGANKARNMGIDLAKGEFIAFQDSDDVWAENKLEVQLNALNISEADVCFCRKSKFDITGTHQETSNMDLREGIIPYEVLYTTPRAGMQTILARNSVFDTERFDENVKKMQEYEWCLRAGEKFTFFFVAESLVDQYLQRDSITVMGEKDYRIEKETIKYIYDKFKENYRSNPGLKAVLLKRYAVFKTLAGENSSAELKKVYQMTGRKVDLMKYMAEKSVPGVLKQWFLFRRRNQRRIAS